MIDLSDYPVTTSKSREYLNQRQLADYEAERRDCLTWLLTYGKRPQEVIGYAPSTIKFRSARMDIFYRFGWDQEGGYTVNIDQTHADDWMTHLAHRDVSAVHKVNCQKALRLLYKWRHHQRGLPEWEPEFRFRADTSRTFGTWSSMTTAVANPNGSGSVSRIFPDTIQGSIPTSSSEPARASSLRSGGHEDGFDDTYGTIRMSSLMRFRRPRMMDPIGPRARGSNPRWSE